VTEEIVVAGRLLDDDLDVVEPRAELFRQRLNRVPDKALELSAATDASTDGVTPRPTRFLAGDVPRSP
jgi:hypothetical protein